MDLPYVHGLRGKKINICKNIKHYRDNLKKLIGFGREATGGERFEVFKKMLSLTFTPHKSVSTKAVVKANK